MLLPDNPYRSFLRTRQLAAFCGRHQFSPAYRAVQKVIGTNPFWYFRSKAAGQENSLFRSGGLVWVTFWADHFPMTRLDTNSSEVFIEVASIDDDIIHIKCLPKNVPYLQSRFCCITHRVPHSALARMAGFYKDDIGCRLPDGSVVELEPFEKWLNSSITAGWKVGVGMQSGRGQQFMLGTRERLQKAEAP
jgi:hypothetical protein